MRNDPFLETGEFMVACKQANPEEQREQDKESARAFDQFLNPLKYTGEYALKRAVILEIPAAQPSPLDDFGVIDSLGTATEPRLAI